MENIRPGSIVKGPNWPEPVEMKLIEEVGKYVHVVGATTLSRQHIDQMIPRDEFSELLIEAPVMAFSEEPWKVFLALEATRYRFASMYDPLLAMNTSKIDPLPHQIEAVYGYVLKLPRIRFLIADDPGAGKTIMAGLIIKELKLRHLVTRILVVAPGHLKDQWQREMQEKFDERLAFVDRGALDAVYGENVWLRENQIITSMDFAKREEVLPSIAAADFDLVIVDEAHKMSAYRYGDKLDKTERYKLGEALSRIAEHFLLLTATPHRGDPENFRLFLDLLEPGFFATSEMLYESIKNKDNPLFIRRVKEDLKDFEGKPLFLPRHVKTIPFNLGADSPKEKELYNSLSRYVNTQYNKALTRDKRRNIAFALVILQRRLASSTYALLRSLERRKKRLEDLLTEVDQRRPAPEGTFDFETIEDLSEEDRWKEEEIWETLSVAENREELEKEIRTIEGLVESAKSIIRSEEEIKLRELRKSLDQLTRTYPDKQDKKILIFTESRDTLEYLQQKLRTWGYTTSTIHGGMRLEERIKAEAVFKTETQVLVGTEAAGEGINLQFCHLMINYDIPWNPNRLEQRMGRIHRYGQQKEVYVFNLVAEDTREGRVLSKLFEKLEEIRQALGSDKVFDVLSEVLYDRNLPQLLMEAAANARSIDEILKDVDVTVDEDYLTQVKENLGESLATRYIDYTRIEQMAQQAREYRLIPEYTEAFFRKALTKAEATPRQRKDGFLAVDSVPFEIRRIAQEDAFKRSHGGVLQRYPKITFDREIAFKNPDAEFVSFGHPLFEAVMTWIENRFSDSLFTGATFTDPDGELDGYILFYEGEIRDGTGDVAGKRLFPLCWADGEIQSISPAVVWDLAEEGGEGTASLDIERVRQVASDRVLFQLEGYKKEILAERERQAAIKRKYGITSLDYLIVRLDGELISLYARRDQGDNVDLPIRNKEQRKQEYERALAELNIQIGRETSLTMSMPRFVGIIRVQPAHTVGEAMRSDAEIERIGMRVAMEYETKNGRLAQDVSVQNLGFDIRSTDEEKNVRYIEVKARAHRGPVALTQNEWFKAKRFKDDYYLYAVMNVGGQPQLFVIQNPAENLDAQERVEAVRYVVPFEEIASKGAESVG
jgi:superfamily II DNA or RNA helicase